MAFTVQEFHDLVVLLTQHPEWRAELRRLVLTEELLALPPIVHDLAEGQQHTTQQVVQLAQQMAQLTQQMTQLTQQMTQLTQQMTQLTQQVAQLTEAQQRTERQIIRLQDDVGELKGIILEERYRNRAFAYFSRLIRGTHALTGDELVALLGRAVAEGRLSEDGMDEIARADVVVRGQRRESPDEVYLVVEVSWGVGPGDVERAVRRAALLAQTGLQTMPVVAGERITDDAAELARAMRVWQVLDGRVTAPNGH